MSRRPVYLQKTNLSQHPRAIETHMEETIGSFKMVLMINTSSNINSTDPGYKN
jgi:hypothetical protein